MNPERRDFGGEVEMEISVAANGAFEGKLTGIGLLQNVNDMSAKVRLAIVI